MRTYDQLIPEKVLSDMPEIEQSIAPTIKGYCRNNLMEVISIVARHTRKDGKAIPLKMEYIKKMVPQGDKYLKGLIRSGVVKRSGNAIPGKVSYKYRFSPEYKSRFESVPLLNAKLIRRNDLVHSELRKEGAKSARGRLDQVKYLNRLQIDPGYKEMLEKKYPDSVKKYNSRIASATRIGNGEAFYNVDDTSGRFHSNVTNLAKDLRPYLRINGEPLVNVDIRNSQPYLSTIILTDPSKVSWMTTNPAFALLLQSLKVSHKEDVKKYISLVVFGELYEYLKAEFAREGLHLSRSKTKVQVLRILFARNRKPKNPTNALAREVFKRHFPTVHRIFSKVRGSEKGNEFQNFKRFAILLQKIEAYLMLDVVMKRISRELPGTIAITIHDSVMTGILTNQVNQVRQIISEELTKFVGFSPMIKVEGNGQEGEERKVGNRQEGSRGERKSNMLLQPLEDVEYQVDRKHKFKSRPLQSPGSQIYAKIEFPGEIQGCEVSRN